MPAASWEGCLALASPRRATRAAGCRALIAARPLIQVLSVVDWCRVGCRRSHALRTHPTLSRAPAFQRVLCGVPPRPQVADELLPCRDRAAAVPAFRVGRWQ